MSQPNIFTYRQSELPEFTDETKAEIAAVDVWVANLICRIQGNYHALNYLYEILQDGLNSCDLNLNSIQVVPDDYKPENKISLTDLPIEQKRVVFDTAFANSIMLKMISVMTGESLEKSALEVARAVEECLKNANPDDEKIEGVISYLVNTINQPKGAFGEIVIPL